MIFMKLIRWRNRFKQGELSRSRPGTYRCKGRLPWRFRSPRNDDPGKKHLFQRQRDSGAIVLAFKLSIHGWQAFIESTHPDRSRNSWQPSR